MVTLCSLNEDRCLWNARMMLKRFHSGCKNFFHNNYEPPQKTAPKSSLPESSPIAQMDVDQLDVYNGVYKGRVWAFKLLSDETQAEIPSYLEISAHDQVLDVFETAETRHSMTKEKNPTVESYNLLNMMYPCGDEICTISKFTEYYNKFETDGEKREIYKAEIETIEDSMRDATALDRCMVVQFKHVDGPETEVLCTLDASYLA